MKSRKNLKVGQHISFFYTGIENAGGGFNHMGRVEQICIDRQSLKERFGYVPRLSRRFAKVLVKCDSDNNLYLVSIGYISLLPEPTTGEGATCTQ
jgi:hypothetical protein